MNNQTRIRPAEPKDIGRIGALLIQVCNVHHEGRPDLFQKNKRKYDDAELMALLSDPDSPIFVYTDEGDTVLGYCFCQLQRHDGRGALAEMTTLYIDDLCVDASCRGGGIGRALYEYTRNYARSIGCYNLTLNVWARNESAMRFYESIGMQVQKIGMETIL